jgi:quercetin dioxygenase-like cupin family protein
MLAVPAPAQPLDYTPPDLGMPRVNLCRWDALPLEKITEMVARKVMASGPSTLTQAYLKKGTVVPVHAHEADLVIYVLQGALRTQVDREDLTVREGDVLIVPAGVPHQAESLDDTFVMTFSGGSSPPAAKEGPA